MIIKHSLYYYLLLQSTGNGNVERLNRTIHYVMAKKVQEEIQTWDLYLNQTLADIKFHGNESTEYSLFFLLYNRHVVLPLDTMYYIKT